MDLPLNLLILRTVQHFRRIPLELLYDKVPASNMEIDKLVVELANKGAVRIDGDLVIANR